MIFKYQTDDPSAARDRAGARVVVHLANELDEACAVVRQLFPDATEERKSDAYGPQEFGYRGIHFDAPVQEPLPNGAAALGTVVCEIQVRTVAEHAWSVMSHLLTYKSPAENALPVTTQRRVNRLIALVELFDSESVGAHADILALPEYQVHRVAYELDRLHSRIVGNTLSTL